MMLAETRDSIIILPYVNRFELFAPTIFNIS